MGADSSAKNAKNAPEFICPICLTKPKSSWFQQKGSIVCVQQLFQFDSVSVCLPGTLTIKKLLMQL